MKLYRGRNVLLSPMENNIKNYLKKFNIKFITEATHKTLINPKTNKNLYFDFYFPQLNLIVEYDGAEYHNSEDVIERDKFKENWAKSHNIKVIRFNRKHSVRLELKKILDRFNIERKKKPSNIIPESKPILSDREKYKLSKQNQEFISFYSEPEFNSEKSQKYKIKHKRKRKKLSPI
jgi:hypothetical protein